MVSDDEVSVYDDEAETPSLVYTYADLIRCGIKKTAIPQKYAKMN